MVVYNDETYTVAGLATLSLNAVQIINPGCSPVLMPDN